MLRLSGTRTSPNRSIHLRWSNEELRDGSQTDTITPQVSQTCFTPMAGDLWNTAMLPAGCVCCSKSTMVLLASHMILISSHTDILHDTHVKQICIPSQHTSAGLTILNVLSSPKTIVAWNALPKSVVTGSTLDATGSSKRFLKSNLHIYDRIVTQITTEATVSYSLTLTT